MIFGNDASGHKNLRANPFEEAEHVTDEEPKSPSKVD